MFTVTYKGFPVNCDSAAEAVEFIDAADRPTIQAEIQTRPRATTRKATKRKATKPDRAEKNKRNAAARAAYLEKHPGKAQPATEKAQPVTSTTSRLEALPSKELLLKRQEQMVKPTGRGKGSRANTGQAVIDTLKRSPSPLTLDEIDTDLEKSGWPYKGTDRKGAIRATLARLKANGTVSVQKKGTGIDTMKMFRLERTNGDTPSPVEQVLNGPTSEERAEADSSAAAEAEAAEAAEAEAKTEQPYRF